MCMPDSCCQYCGTYCKSANSNGCKCCYCYWGDNHEYFCDWCKPEENENDCLEDDYPYDLKGMVKNK